MKRRTSCPRLIAGVVASSLLLASLPKLRAQSVDAITAWTKDGAIYRGELVERVPGDHVTLKLADGEVRRIEWKDLDHDSLAVPSVASDSASTAPVASASERPPRARPSRPRLHLAGEPTLTLERESTATIADASGRAITHFDILCRAPCDIPVAPGVGYRVGGDGRRPSETFSIFPGETKIEARLGNSSAFTGGFITALVGLTIGTVGVLWYRSLNDLQQTTLAYGVEQANVTTVTNPNKGNALAVVGVGGVIAILGTVVLLANVNHVEVGDRTIAKKAPTIALTPRGFVF